MSDNERFDRLERRIKLVVLVGLHERRNTREKINVLINARAKTEEAMARMAEAQARVNKRSEP